MSQQFAKEIIALNIDQAETVPGKRSKEIDNDFVDYMQT